MKTAREGARKARRSPQLDAGVLKLSKADHDELVARYAADLGGEEAAADVITEALNTKKARDVPDLKVYVETSWLKQRVQSRREHQAKENTNGRASGQHPRGGPSANGYGSDQVLEGEINAILDQNRRD